MRVAQKNSVTVPFMVTRFFRVVLRTAVVCERRDANHQRPTAKTKDSTSLVFMPYLLALN